jgi:RES domain-containing protein
MLESRKAPNEIFRIGRKPDPWQPPDWSRANSDGTFGNRFDDPAGYYRVLYAASRSVSCFVETLARFRPDLTLRAELSEIQGEDDFVPLGEVPLEWCDQRLIGTAAADGDYADIYSSLWIAYLRPKLADECLRLGLQDLDAAVLQNAAPRRISQLASRQAYEVGCPGIYYRSRYGHDLENWAIFEPFPIHPRGSKEIRESDESLQKALEILGLKLRRK